MDYLLCIIHKNTHRQSCGSHANISVTQ